MYALDTNEARKADSTGSMIKEIGKYTGKFTQAEDVTASTGTKGVALSFESDAGQKARVSLYTQKSNGERIMGFQTLMAVMTCLKLRNIAPKAGAIKFWDNDAKAEKTKDGTVFPDLCGKPIGLLLETEDYEKQDGSVGTRMVLKGVFQAGSELTASEILDQKTKPEQLERMVSSLRHRPLKGHKAPVQSAGVPATESDMGDDIPW
jgi:biotin-(acetyl-CoA carboxylase) ligase